MSQKSAYEAPQKEFSFSLLLLPYLEKTGQVWELSLLTSFRSHFSPKLFPLCIPFYNYSHFWYKKHSNTIIKATDPLSREKSILSKNVFQWRWWICASLCNDPSFLYGEKKRKMSQIPKNSLLQAKHFHFSPEKTRMLSTSCGSVVAPNNSSQDINIS